MERRRITVEMPIPLHEAVMRESKARGLTFDEFARLAVREKIAGGERGEGTIMIEMPTAQHDAIMKE